MKITGKNSDPVTAYLGIGSNLGDRETFIEEAVAAISRLQQTSLTGRSSILETDPVDFLDQPKFLNMVVAVRTRLSPHELLDELLAIEKNLGRERLLRRGPRTIDLDILIYADLVHESDRLIIPHRAITNRLFVMQHLLELDPELVDPRNQQPYKEIHAHVSAYH